MASLLLLLACTQAPDPGAAYFHERTWDDVRGRAIGHLAAEGRDLARARAMAGDYAGCAAAYTLSAQDLAAVPIGTPPPRRIRDAYAAAATRDAAFCAALAAGQPPPVPTTPIAALRARQVIDGPAFDPGPPPTPPALVLETSDPAGRTVLRAILTEAWVDSVDPLRPTDPWDYWEPSYALTAHAQLAGHTEPPRPWYVTADDLARPPTGDTWVDSAGLPGPRALTPGGRPPSSPDDVALAARLSAAAPADVPTLLDPAELTRGPDGERHLRAVRTAVLRALARSQQWTAAARLVHTFRDERPFDKDCPDHAAVVLGIEGRLLLLAGDASAEATLRQAREATLAFLATTGS